MTNSHSKLPAIFSSSCSSSASSSTASISSVPTLLTPPPPMTPASVRHDPDAPGEAMSVFFPEGIPQVVLDYLGGDIAATNKISLEKRQQFKLFNRNIQDVLRPLATRVATLILGGEEEEITEALALVRTHPDILRCRVIARDRLGSPELCLMPEKKEKKGKDERKEPYFISIDKKNSDRISLFVRTPHQSNRIYMSMEGLKQRNICYEAITSEGEILIANIPPNKLAPFKDRDGANGWLDRETFDLYLSYILKIAVQRGHIDNRLYVGQKEDGSLEYQVLTFEGKFVQDFITQKELQQEIKFPLTAQTLHRLQGAILEITSKRKHTLFGRPIDGKPLQIAAMAGDVNLRKEEIKEEKYRGMVEQLISAGDLSAEEITQQLDEVMTGKAAQQNNAARNQRVQNLLEKFGNDICKVSMDGIRDIPDAVQRFKKLKDRCQPLIHQLEEELQPDPNEIIKSGYIFDPSILSQLDKWFTKPEILVQFGGLGSSLTELFWFVVLGLSQKNFSARDGHVAQHSVESVIFNHKAPQRTLNNKYGTSGFNSSSGLGRDFCLGPTGAQLFNLGLASSDDVRCAVEYFEELMSIKNSNIAKQLTPQKNRSLSVR